MNEAFARFARLVNHAASTPLATALAFALVLAWFIAGPRMHYSNLWQLQMNTLSAVITFLMVFVLNNAQNRDTAAINSKLDAVILALEQADNRLVGLENQPIEDAAKIQQEVVDLAAVALEADDTEHCVGS